MTHPDRDRLLARLLGPTGPELTCEQCFDELDRYVELELRNAPADGQIPGMRAHLEGCPPCAEDHESLLAFVAAQEAIAPFRRAAVVEEWLEHVAYGHAGCRMTSVGRSA